MANNPPASSKPLSVLMVCLGNICRSPMAEAVFLDTARSQGHKDTVITADSAGTGAYHEGDTPDSRTMAVLQQNGITDYEHYARKVRKDDFTSFDYILAMDEDNLYHLKRVRKVVVEGMPDYGERSEWWNEHGVAKVMLFGDFGGKKGEEVDDPYYGGNHGFTTAFKQMKRFSKGFLEDAVEKEWRNESVKR